MELKPDKLPTTGYALFVKLYCKMKKATCNKPCDHGMMEIVKSYMALSPAEKQHFANKAKECQREYKKLFANYLKNYSYPYLKKKKIRKSNPDNEEQLNDKLEEIVDIPQPNLETTTNNEDITTQDSDNNDQRTENVMEEIKEDNVELPTTHEHYVELPEPRPPIVKCSRELFELLKSSNNSDRTWEELTENEKRRHRTAVSKLKQAYINNYVQYLESLPPQQLFNHYIKKI